MIQLPLNRAIARSPNQNAPIADRAIGNESSIAIHQPLNGIPAPECYARKVIPAHRIIPGILAQVIRPAPLCQEKVEFAWRTSVGPAVSRATTVRLDEAGVLWIRAQDAQWRREVERSVGLIRSRLDTLLGPNVIIRVEIICHG